MTEPILSDSIVDVEIRFSQAARRHRVGRTSALYVMSTVKPTEEMTPQGNAGWRYVGPDERGRELEIIAVEVGPADGVTYLLVIHVMPTHLRR